MVRRQDSYVLSFYCISCVLLAFISVVAILLLAAGHLVLWRGRRVLLPQFVRADLDHLGFAIDGQTFIGAAYVDNLFTVSSTAESAVAMMEIDIANLGKWKLAVIHIPKCSQ